MQHAVKPDSVAKAQQRAVERSRHDRAQTAESPVRAPRQIEKALEGAKRKTPLSSRVARSAGEAHASQPTIEMMRTALVHEQLVKRGHLLSLKLLAHRFANLIHGQAPISLRTRLS